ncbi:hypothetical protein L596_010844 [Steinernema carpocapsae]|uniref:Uncharacterized protein n=1 Tax=Steinernema carpocapsae TaxID=34508 RepID=A0A4U5PLZ5_STECR|nr:hypothetical protein L596_010844 [Steinernema carpocapsae]
MRITGTYSLVFELEVYVQEKPTSHCYVELISYEAANCLRKLSESESGLKRKETRKALRLSKRIKKLAKVLNGSEEDCFQPLLAEAFREAIGLLKKTDHFRIVWKQVPDSFVHLPPEIISDVLTPDVDGYCFFYTCTYEKFSLQNGPWSEVASLMAPQMAEKFEDETKYKENPLSRRFTGMTKSAVRSNLSVYTDQELIEIALKLRGSILVHTYDPSSWSHSDQVFYSNLDFRNFTSVTMNVISKSRKKCKAFLQRLLKSPNLREFHLVLSMELELEDDLLNFVSMENFFILNYKNFMLDTLAIERRFSRSKLASEIFEFFKRKNFGLDVKVRYFQLCLDVDNAERVKESLKMKSLGDSTEKCKCSSLIEVKNDHDEDVSVVAFLKDSDKYEPGTFIFRVYAGERSE